MFFERGVRVSVRRVVLSSADSATIIAAFVLAAVIRLSADAGIVYVKSHLGYLVGSGIIFLLVFYICGMYERQILTQHRYFVRTPLVAVTLGVLLVVAAFYGQFKLAIGRGILAMASGMILLGSWAVRGLFRLAVGYGWLTRNTLVVGDQAQAASVINLIYAHPDAGYQVRGVVYCGQRPEGGFVEQIPVLGPVSDLKKFVNVYDVETVVVATSLRKEREVLRILRPIRYAGVQLLDYVALHEELAQEIPLDHIDDEWLMSAAMNSSRIHIRQIKRVMDVFVALTGLIVLSPVFLLALILVKISSPGPAIYRQKRVGLDGREYVLLKIRTMVPSAERDTGPVWCNSHDRRITAVGRFLRKWRMDEIPQLVNVLRGEMSLVGPRPERPEFVEILSEAIPFYRERLLVRPGITGWAQVNYPYTGSISAARRKLQFDLFYIKNMSFLLDVAILLRTFRTIVAGLRYAEEHPGTTLELPVQARNSEAEAAGNRP